MTGDVVHVSNKLFECRFGNLETKKQFTQYFLLFLSRKPQLRLFDSESFENPQNLLM